MLTDKLIQEVALWIKEILNLSAGVIQRYVVVFDDSREMANCTNS
jgi:hypothetical protein